MNVQGELAINDRIAEAYRAIVASAIDHARAAAGLVLVTTTFTFSRMRVISR
jgi:hypothetical protein